MQCGSRREENRTLGGFYFNILSCDSVFFRPELKRERVVAGKQGSDGAQHGKDVLSLSGAFWYWSMVSQGSSGLLLTKLGKGSWKAVIGFAFKPLGLEPRGCWEQRIPFWSRPADGKLDGRDDDRVGSRRLGVRGYWL